MDAVALLERDHETAEALFRRYESLDDDAEERTRVVRELVRELSIHAAIEEQLFYPQVKDALAGGEAIAAEALREHREVKEVLADLDRMDASDPAFDPKVRALIADVRHHVEEEETEMLPQLRSALPSDRLNELGEMMEMAKAIAPTRPHPHAPSTPPGNVAAGAAAGVVDRARDVVSGRAGERKEKATTGRPRTSKPTARRTSAKGTTRRTTQKGTTRRASGGRRGRTTGPVFDVTPDPRGGWRAEKRGASRAAARSDRKSEVVKRARELAKAQGGRLVIRGQDGKIQEERTYGEDPRRSRG